MDIQARYGFGKTVDLPFDQAVERLTQALSSVGFGIVSDVNVAGTLKQKLDRDVPPYRILGACNPSLAHRALTADPSIGLLLPCNVVVREDGAGRVHVEFLDPDRIAELAGGPEIAAVASEAGQALRSAMDAL